MKGPFELSLKIVLVLLKTYLKEINLPLFIIRTFTHGLNNYSKLSKIFPIQSYVTYFRHDE